jgi:hypothetical protein
MDLKCKLVLKNMDLKNLLSWNAATRQNTKQNKHKTRQASYDQG